MVKIIVDFGSSVAAWANANEGILTIILFAITLLIGWASGIFRALRRKPKFKVRLLSGPTFCCTFLTGKKHKKDGADYDGHRTAVALYLDVTNVGAAPSSIRNIAIAYHWDLVPFSWLWLRNTIGWFWLYNQAVILTDFHVYIGKQAKGFPFLVQKSMITGDTAETFLESGRSTNGVVYFEQPESWGGCYPRQRNGKVKIKVRLEDAFARHHTSRFQIESVALTEARKYNPAFGSTFSELHGEKGP